MKSITLHLKIIFLAAGLILVAAICQEAAAQKKSQLLIGGSYETQSPSPNNGFGIHVENDLLTPIVGLGIRAQFNDFWEGEKFPGKGIGNHLGWTYHHRRYRYDFGLTALVKLRLGLLSPYVGAGIGTSRSSGYKFIEPGGPGNDHSNNGNGGSQGNGNDHSNNGNGKGNGHSNDSPGSGNNNPLNFHNHGLPFDAAQSYNSGMYYQGTVGAVVTLFPRLQPFVEYRFQKNSFREMFNSYKNFDNNGIWSIGFSIQI